MAIGRSSPANNFENFSLRDFRFNASIFYPAHKRHKQVSIGFFHLHLRDFCSKTFFTETKSTVVVVDVDGVGPREY